MKAIAPILVGLPFVLVGLTHFISPETFTAMMPGFIPWHSFWVYFTGLAEVAGGLGLMIPHLRRAAGWGLLALLIGVFPANIHMAINEVQLPGFDPLPAWALWARLPFQLVFAAAVWWVALRGTKSD